MRVHRFSKVFGFIGFIALITAIFCLCMTTASAETSGIYTYSVRDDGSAIIKEVNKNAKGNITVASVLDGHIVTEIGYRAFQECKNIESVKIPDTVIAIGEAAFNECTSLKSVTTGASVTELSGYLFFNCSSLETVTISGKVQSIGDYVCYGCDSLKTLFLPDTVTSLSDKAFDRLPKTTILFSFSEYVNNYALSHGVSCVNPFSWADKPRDFYVLTDMTTSLATLSWSAVPGAKGYIVYMYDAVEAKYKAVTSLTGTKYTLQNLLPGTKYNVRVRAYLDFQGKRCYSQISSLTLRTPESAAQKAVAEKRRAAGDYAYVTTKALNVNIGASTQSVFTRWASVSPISQFTDRNGYFCFAHADSSYLYIEKLDANQNLVTTLKIAKQYNLLGGVACDSAGYYYVVWGNEAKKGTTGIVTMAVSKYKSSGVLVKTAVVRAADDKDTRVPFNAGNCSIAINNGLLICSYSREMLSGHQSSGVIAVNTSNMTINTDYYSYVSHSFDQRVIIDKDGSTAWFADHGDCFPRGFQVTKSVNGSYDEYIPFHFYASQESYDNMDMYVINETKAQLGGLAQTATGIVIAGASVKGMTSSEYKSQSKNLFIVNTDSAAKLQGSASRTGECFGVNVTDSAVRWLTNYSAGYNVNNPQAVYTDDDRIVVLWELVKNGVFNGSYYMVLSSNGVVLQNITPLGSGIRLNANEDPIYKNGCVYWATAQGAKVYVRSLKVGAFKNFVVTGVKVTAQTSTSVTVSWNKTDSATGYRVRMFNSGKYMIIRVLDANTTSYTVTSLRPNSTYVFKVDAKRSDNTANDSPLSAAVKGYTAPKAVEGLKASSSANAVKLTWDATDGATWYQIYKYNGKTYAPVRTISASANSYTVTGLSSGSLQYFKVRAIRNAYGVKSYGNFSVVLGTATRPVNSAVSGVASSQKGALAVKWSKSAGASGYMVQYSTTSNFSSGVITKDEASLYKVYIGLTSGKTYYVRVRAYINVGSVKLYSPGFSAVKSIKIK